MRAVALTVRNNLNNASVMTWSLANEPAGNRPELGAIGTRARALHRRGRGRRPRARRHAPCRHRPPVSLWRAADPPGLCQSGRARGERVLRVVRLLQGRPPARRRPPPPSSVRTSTRFTRPTRTCRWWSRSSAPSRFAPAPSSSRGTQEFQRKFVVDHLRIHASKPYVAGSIHWALRDFRVHPDLGRRCPGGVDQPALEQQEPDRRDERPEAGLLRPEEALPQDPDTSMRAAAAALPAARGDTRLRPRLRRRRRRHRRLR